MDIPKVLNLIRPNEIWSMSGTTYDGLKWLDKTPMPTMDELNKGQAILDSMAYMGLRRAAYPALEDQLDAIWKGGQAMADMQAQIQAVKAKYPAPSPAPAAANANANAAKT